MLVSDNTTFPFLAGELDSSVNSTNHRSTIGYKVTELLEAVNKLAIVNENKERIIESGAPASYIRLLKAVELQSPSPADKVKSPARLGRSFSAAEAATVDEQFAAAQGLWTLASSCPKQIREYPGCVEGFLSVVAYHKFECFRKLMVRGSTQYFFVVKLQSDSDDVITMSG